MTSSPNAVCAAPPSGGRLHVTTSWVDAEAIVDVAGEIDLAAAPVLRNALQEVSARGQPDVVIDAGLVDFIDASGVGIILAARRRLALEGRRLVVRRPSSVVRRVLGILGLDDLVEGTAE